jgi:hypothetical protein
MDVKDYAGRVLLKGAHAITPPSTLTLSDELVVGFLGLYTSGEQDGREYGYNLVYLRSLDKLVPSVRYAGLTNTCPIPTMQFFAHCADVHCHPTDSIGDIDGYSPHSMEDFLAFSEQLYKPLFMRFVVTGTHIYAAVHHKGYTRFDAETIKKAAARLSKQIDTYYEANCPASPATVVEEASNAAIEASLRGEDANAVSDRVVAEYKRRTPGLGAYATKVTMEACLEVAPQVGIAFYKRIDTYTLAREV